MDKRPSPRAALDAGTLKKFLLLDEEEDERFRATVGAAISREEKDEFVRAFYEHLDEFEEPSRIIADPNRRARLRESLAAYLDALFTSPVDADYVRERTAIGHTHLRIGLYPRWYLGAYGLFVDRWLPRFAGEADRDLLARAFLKRLFLDATLAMESYVTARVEHLSRETDRLERELVRWERLAAVGSMAAKVAHEIRNPLSAISLNAELLEDEVTNLPEESREESRRLLKTILGGVDRLNAVIEEYLTFARLPRLALEDVRLDELFDHLEQLLAPEIERRGIRMSIDLDGSLPIVSGDRRQLEQALLNILRNAEEAMPLGGEVQVQGRLGPRGIELSIVDTGGGIPEESLPLIFDPFFTTKDAGTGLGLAYVQQVLREHRGTIVCKSRVGQGTEFIITLPATPGIGSSAGSGTGGSK